MGHVSSLLPSCFLIGDYCARPWLVVEDCSISCICRRCCHKVGFDRLQSTKQLLPAVLHTALLHDCTTPYYIPRSTPLFSCSASRPVLVLLTRLCVFAPKHLVHHGENLYRVQHSYHSRPNPWESHFWICIFGHLQYSGPARFHRLFRS